MQALANLHQWKGDHDIDRNHGGGSSLSKHSQPAFPGHPPPLVRLAPHFNVFQYALGSFPQSLNSKSKPKEYNS